MDAAAAAAANNYYTIFPPSSSLLLSSERALEFTAPTIMWSAAAAVVLWKQATILTQEQMTGSGSALWLFHRDSNVYSNISICVCHPTVHTHTNTCDPSEHQQTVLPTPPPSPYPRYPIRHIVTPCKIYARTTFLLLLFFLIRLYIVIVFLSNPRIPIVPAILLNENLLST